MERGCLKRQKVMKTLKSWWRASCTLLCMLLIIAGLGVWSPKAYALTPIDLTDLSYEECPEELADGAVSPGGAMMRAANCFIVTGTAVNNSPRPVVDADIFGRIFDADNNPVMQNRNRLGAIPFVPIGESQFELRISVPDKMLPPLRLEKFKASGFASNVSQFGNIEEEEFEDYSFDELS